MNKIIILLFHNNTCKKGFVNLRYQYELKRYVNMFWIHVTVTSVFQLFKIQKFLEFL